MWQIQHDHELDDFAQRVRDSLGIQPIEGMGHVSNSYPQGFAETTPNAPSSIVTPSFRIAPVLDGVARKGPA